MNHTTPATTPPKDAGRRSNGRCPIMKTLAYARRARECESQGDRAQRNAIASDIFKAKSRRKIAHAGLEVETWYDRKSGNWITTTNNESAECTGNIMSAAVSHLWALYAILDRCETQWPFKPLATRAES